MAAERARMEKLAAQDKESMQKQLQKYQEMIEEQKKLSQGTAVALKSPP